MHIHILGIGGTFMAGVALLAKAGGHKVTGSDQGLYPPMSTQLEQAGIEVLEGYKPAHLMPAPDQVVVGNAMSRGNLCVEYMLSQGLNYISGPQWLAENILQGRHVLAVAGTHGKTTTSAMLAHILNQTGDAPGFLIGGIAADLGCSAKLGAAQTFVVEADEYDTAFFDKRSKFIHYRPKTLVLNNLEYDHADIFADLFAIKQQFHHVIRTVPENGRLVVNGQDKNLAQTLEMGCWTPKVFFNSQQGWYAKDLAADQSHFEIYFGAQYKGRLAWYLCGQHNQANALAAIAAAEHAGVSAQQAIQALAQFKGVKRRLELRGRPNNIAVYDDFAHHPTAIQATLAGLHAADEQGRILAVFEPRSNTMKAGVHSQTLADSFKLADYVFAFDGGLDWDLNQVLSPLADKLATADDISALVEQIAAKAKPGDRVVVMSNGGFGGIHQRLLERLA